MNRELFDMTIKEQETSIMKVALKSGIAPSDFYQCLKGQKPFFPKWRGAICATLRLEQNDLFPDEMHKSRL